MHATSKPAELVAAPQERAPDSYCGAPLGVEAAWWPNGIDVPGVVFRAKDEEDAVRIAHDSPFGLGGSIFTSDTRHGAELARKLSTGMVFINHPAMVNADLPMDPGIDLPTPA